METNEPDDTVRARGEVRLPSGMTQEEADRLVREADERAKEQD